MLIELNKQTMEEAIYTQWRKFLSSRFIFLIVEQMNKIISSIRSSSFCTSTFTGSLNLVFLQRGIHPCRWNQIHVTTSAWTLFKVVNEKDLVVYIPWSVQILYRIEQCHSPWWGMLSCYLLIICSPFAAFLSTISIFSYDPT